MLNKDVPLRQQRHPKYPDPSHDEVLWKDAKVETWRFHWRKLCITLKEMKSLSLKDEVSTLSKIVYKHHNQMKRDKSFQLLKKISTLSQRFQTMELFPQLNKYQDILNSFLKRKALISNKLLIPKEEFTIIIVEQLLGAVKLLEKIHSLMINCTRAVEGQLGFGFFVNFNMFALASISKIWSEVKRYFSVLSSVYDIFLDILQDIHGTTTKGVWPDSLRTWIGHNFENFKMSNCSFLNAAGKEVFSSTASANQLSSNNSLSPCAPPSKDIGAPLSPTSLSELRQVGQSDVKHVNDETDLGAPLSPSTLAKLRGPRDETVKDDLEMHDDDTKDVDLGAPLSPSTLSKIRRQGNDDNDDDEAEKKPTEPKHEDKVSISSARKFDEESNEVSNQDEKINPTHSYTSEQGNEESVTEQEQSFQLEILSKQPKTSRDTETETSRDIETETSRDTETETSRDIETEKSRDIETETPRDIETETPRDIETETPRDIEIETSRDTETETSRDIETETPRDIETETPRDIEAETPMEIETDCQVESSNVLATEEEMTDPKTLDCNETGKNASTENADGDVIEMKDDVTVSEKNDVILENDRTIESSDNETMNKSIEEEITESAMNEVEIIDSKSEGTMIDDVIDHSKNDVNTVELCETIEMEIPTIDDVMTESKDGVIVDSVTDKNNDIIINSEANYINLEKSPKMAYWSRKQPEKKPCPFCGKMVRNVRPSLNSEFLKTPIRMRGKIRLQSRDKGQLKAHIYDVKHELIHSEGLAMTRKLIHILRCLKMTLKKLEKA